VELAKTLGSNEALRFENKEDCFEKLFAFYRNELPTVAIDTTGKAPCIELAYELSHPQARVILVGVPKKGEKSSIYTLPLHFGKTFVGSKGGGSNPDIDIPFLLEELESGRLDFSHFPVKTFLLNDINHAILSLRSGTPGRMIIDMEGV
jgi:Zn-dependent alcohol dehydrogenase